MAKSAEARPLMQPREMVLRMTDFQRHGFRLRRHLLRLAVLTLPMLSFASAIAHEESPVSL